MLGTPHNYRYDYNIRGSVYNAQGSKVGEILDSRIYDVNGRRMGEVINGRVYDANGGKAGEVISGHLYDALGNQVGRINSEGSTYNLAGEKIGRVVVSRHDGTVVGATALMLLFSNEMIAA